MSKTFTSIRNRLALIDQINDSATSPLVAGDNAPVGSTYLGPQAIPWLKSGATATAWSQQLMRAPYFNVLDYGAVGDGVANDRAAIIACYTAAAGVGGGVVYFPPGTYAVQRTSGTVTGARVFDLTSTESNLTFMGDGRSSRILLTGDLLGGEARIFEVRDGCKNVVFKNLCLDGSGVTNAGEQVHAIEFLNQSGSVDPVTGESVVVDCYFNYINGDGIRFLGNSDNRVRDILVKRSFFQMGVNGGGDGSRACLSFQRSADDVTADLNYLTGSNDQEIDFEPTGTGSNLRNRITRNIITSTRGATLVTLTGNSGTFPHTRSIFSQNSCVGGSVSGLDVQNMVLASNILSFEIVNASVDAVLAFNERIQQMSIQDNILIRSGPTGVSNTMAIQNQSVGENDFISIDGNLLVDTTNGNGGFSFSIRNASKIDISNNLSTLDVSVAGSGGLCRFEGTVENIDDSLFDGNIALAGNAAVTNGVVGGQGLTAGGNISVSNNLIRGPQVGIRLDNSNTNEQVCASHNVITSTSNAVVRSGGGTATDVIIDEGGQTVGATVFTLTGTPEARVSARIGSLACRTDGGAGTALYVKESSPTPSTGWVGK